MKWKMNTAAAFLLMTTVLVACDDTGANAPVSEAYSYTAYDSSGAALVEGTLSFSIKDSSITGSWHLSAIGNAQNIGPQVGFGEMRGGIYTGEIRLNLNPRMVDNNVFLFGQFEGNGFHGEWMWLTFSGWTNAGTFKAQKGGGVPR